MLRISQLLERFKNLKPPGKAIEDEVYRILKEKIKLPEDSFEVVFKKPNLTIISKNPALKNEVFLYKEDIIKTLQEKFSPKVEVRVFFK